MITAVSLVEDSLGTFPLFTLDDFRQDLILQGLDVPLPAPRVASTDRVNDDGADDRTQYHGGRPVSVSLKVFDDQQAALIDQLNAYCAPWRRPYLVVSDSTWPDGTRRLRLRIDQAAAPMIAMPAKHVWRDVQVQWVAPDGVWESTQQVQLTLLASGGASAGRSYGLTFPRAYAPTSGIGQLTVQNPATVRSHQVVRMYGPCAGPRYTCDDTGETIAFTEGLYVNAGEYVEVNTRARTAYYLSDPNSSQLQYVDFSVSSWWRLPSGTSRVRYHPTSQVDVGCSATVTAQPTYL